MRLKTAYYLHLAVFHVAVLALAAWYYEELGGLFFVVEAAVVVSWVFGVWLTRRSLQPLEFIRSFSDLLHEREFSARFSPVGQLEMDRLIELYNSMLRELYDERLRIGEQRGFLERFVEASPVGVVILDFDGRISLLNSSAAKLLRVDAGELSGRRLEALDSDLAVALAQLEAGESRLITGHGVRRLRLEKLAFVDRGFARQFVLVEELTRILNESERAAYEKLIRFMSHEVNNTVAVTNSLLESCRTYSPQIGEEDREDYSRALDVVIGRNEHLNRFMHDFAQVVKLPKPDRRPCDLVALTAGLEVMFRVQCRERDIEWVRSGSDEIPEVPLDPEQMEQALINIVKNAIEAIEQDGTLEVALSVVADEVELSVFDDGCGLDRDTRGELFSPFFSTKSDGQGIGLTLVKEILLKHEFDFDLEPVEDGRTRFRVLIPMA